MSGFSFGHVRPSREPMQSAFMFECMVIVKPLVTECQCLALKGPHEIAQGEALGCATSHRMSPERAKSETLQSADQTGRNSSCSIPPLQGGNRAGNRFPGLRLWASQSEALGSHSAPSGPAAERALDLMLLRESGDPVREPPMIGSARIHGFVHWIPAFAGMTATVRRFRAG
jgi:hypothetical protein